MSEIKANLTTGEQKALSEILNFVIYINNDIGLENCEDENNLCFKVISLINCTLRFDLTEEERQTLKETLLFGAEHMGAAYGYDDDPSDLARVQAQIDICNKLLGLL